MEILSAESTELFIGTEQQPAQVIRVRVRGTEGDDLSHLSQVSVRGERVSTDHPVALDPLPPGELRTVEVGVTVEGTPAPGTTFVAEAVVELDDVIARLPLVVTVAEPGWRMFMVSHFHYDPVWWNTQAAYTETWGTERQFRALFQEPGLALVKAHLEMARRDADYKFVLAELDYLKPYWGVYPEDRDYFRQLLAEGRLELMGGTYNEPNTNLTSAESTIRNAIYGVGYQRDVLGGSPQTAWQLDAFGHDPQFPGIMADAGITSSSWARGPFHEWGPHWVRGPEVLRTVMSHRGEALACSSTRNSTGSRPAAARCSRASCPTTTQQGGGWTRAPASSRRRLRRTGSSPKSRRRPPRATCCFPSGLTIPHRTNG